MSKIKIEWLSDYHDCETCGGSGAEGAKVYKDDILVLDLTPVAYCFDGTNYDQDDVIKEILKYLGHEAESTYDY